MVTVISRFRVRNGLQEEVRNAFLNRPRLVEDAAGFRGINVLTDATDPAVFLLVTRWADEESFRIWHRSAAHHQSHGLMPKGLKLDPSFTALTVGNNIEDPSGAHNLMDAIADRSPDFSRWLMQSESVFALLLAPDGTIRARNRASELIFAPDPAKNSASTIWDYLVCSEGEQLRERLADTGNLQDLFLLLNVMDSRQNQITLEIGLVHCSGATLLLGTQETRHDAQFQDEIFKLTNDLSLMMRESARKNRELIGANETIERLARTDVLTGLANRRSLDEAFLREIARAGRQKESLSVIIADLDRFKSINDEYGHLAGDQVLASAAAVFGKRSRPYDVAARYGGEEFVLLLPGTSSEGAIVIAERIREEIGRMKVPACPRGITISLGVASWMAGETAQQLVSRADAALYIAKSSGRNRVDSASQVPA